MCWSSLIENHCSEWFSLRAIVITMDSLIKWIDLKRYFYSGMWHYKHKQASCGIEALISWEFVATFQALVWSINFSNYTISWSYHIHNPVDLTVLGVDLIAHVESHVAEVTDDTSHLLQIIIHFSLSCIICYPEEIQKTGWVYWEHWLRWAQYPQDDFYIKVNMEMHSQPILVP